MSVLPASPSSPGKSGGPLDSAVWLYGALLAVWLSFVLSIIAPHAIAPLMAVCVALLLLASRPMSRAFLDANMDVMWWAAALCLWSLVSALRSVHVGYGLQQVLVFAFLLAPPLFAGLFARFSAVNRYRFVHAFIWLYLLFVMTFSLTVFKLLPLDLLRGEKALELWPLNRAAVFAVLLAPPAILAIRTLVRQSNMLIAVFLVLLSVPIFMSESESAKLGLLVILAICPLAFWRLSLTARLAFAGTAVLLIVFPFAIRWLTENAISMGIWRADSGPLEARALIWSGMVGFVTQAPVFGNGIEYARFVDFYHSGMKTMHNEVHPHSFLMQIWIDLGLVGVVLFLGFLYALMFRTRMVTGRGGAANLALIVVALAIWAVSHGMWQAWYLGMVAFSACIIVAVTSCVVDAPAVSSAALAQRGAAPDAAGWQQSTWAFWPIGWVISVLMLTGLRYWSLDVRQVHIWGAAGTLMLAAICARIVSGRFQSALTTAHPLASLGIFITASVLLYGFWAYAFSAVFFVPRSSLLGGSGVFFVLAACLREEGNSRG